MPDVVLPYLKAWAALIGAVLTAVSGVVELPTAVTVVLAILTAVATYGVPNSEPLPALGDLPDEHQG